MFANSNDDCDVDSFYEEDDDDDDDNDDDNDDDLEVGPDHKRRLTLTKKDVCQQ